MSYMEQKAMEEQKLSEEKNKANGKSTNYSGTVIDRQTAEMIEDEIMGG